MDSMSLQTWKTFLRNQIEGIASIDLFVVPMIAFQQLHGRVVGAPERGRLSRTRQRRNHRSQKPSTTCNKTAMGIPDKPTAPGSPWQNGFAERLIGSIRRECVDHVVALGEAHLRRILQAYARCYNGVRTHRSLDKDAPFSRPVQRIGCITSHALLGGLHLHYCRI
jgi:Integrase core domain